MLPLLTPHAIPMVVPMDGLISVASNTVNQVKMLMVGVGGLIAIIFVVTAVIRAGGLVLGAIIRAGIGAALIMALCGGLLAAMANSAQKDITNRLNSGGAVVQTRIPQR